MEVGGSKSSEVARCVCTVCAGEGAGLPSALLQEEDVCVIKTK